MPRPPFAFIDESGVLQNDPAQPFFSLGMLVVPDPAGLHQELHRIRNRTIDQGGINPDTFEFKFNKISRRGAKFHRDLISVILSADVRVGILAIDKTHSNYDREQFHSTTWDAYIDFSKTLIRDNCTGDDEVILLADYLGKPKDHPRFYDRELRDLDPVLNATMLESHASLFIQAIDVLIGCVTFQFRNRKLGKSDPHEAKRSVSEHLADELDRKRLDEDFRVDAPCYFSVTEFEPKPPEKAKAAEPSA